MVADCDFKSAARRESNLGFRMPLAVNAKDAAAGTTLRGAKVRRDWPARFYLLCGSRVAHPEAKERYHAACGCPC